MEERTSTSLKRISSNDSNNSNDDDNSNKSSSSSLLFSIPEVQISNIFSFLVLNDFLRLVLVSKDMKIILLKCVHHLCTMPEEIVLYPSHFVPHHHDQHHHNSILSNTNHHDNDHDPTIHHPSSSIILQQPPQPQNLERTKRSTNIKNNKKKRKLNLSLHQLQHIVQRFHNIRYLSLYGLSDLGDSFLPIINDCPAASNLVSIELHGCRIIIHKQQQQQHRYHQLNLRQNKNRLRHVSITGTIFAPYTTFLDSFVSSTSIHYLEFSGCHNLHDDDVLSIFKHTSTTLKELHLSNNCNLIHPTIHSDVLSTLDFKQCQNLQSLPSLHCPNLCHLNLSFCTTLEDVALHQILSSTSSCSLLTLYLKGCKQIKQPIFTSPRCQQLQILDVSLCSQITQMEISCPHLLSLKMGMCVAIKDIYLNVPRLRNLDLSMLPLQQIVLTSSDMEVLNLSGCYALCNDDVKIHCPKLQSVDICGTNLDSKTFKQLLMEHHLNNQKKKTVTILQGGPVPLDWQKLMHSLQ